MAYKDDEQKRREAEERRKQYEEAAKRRQELLAQNEASKAAQQSAMQTARQAAKTTAGAGKTSASAASVNASAASYQKKKQGDNDMRVTAAGRPRNTYDVSKLSYDEAMGIATRIVYDDERDDFLKRWQKANKDASPTMEEMRAQLNSQKPGGIYQAAGKEYSAQIQENFKNEYRVQKTMHEFDGFTDMSGNAINMNTADMETIIRNIRAEPNKKRREGYADAMDALTKTPGSRFYGAEFDKEYAKTFLNSAALSETTYNGIVEEFESMFNPMAGNEESNIASYAEAMEEIESGGYDAYVKKAYVDALNDAYGSQLATDTLPDLTGYTPPQEAAETAQTGAKEKKGGWWDGIKKAASEAVDGFLGKNPMPDGGAVWNAQGEAYSVEDGVSVEVQPKTGEWQGPKQQEKKKAPSLNEALADEKYMQAFIEKKSAKMAASGEDIREVQGPKIKSLMQRSLEDGEYQAFVQEQIARESEGKTEKAPAAGDIDLKNNPVGAWIIARRGEGNQLTQETQDAVNALLASSPAARAISGLDATGSRDLYAQAETGDPFALARANAARFDYISGGYVSVIGSTLGRYIDKARSESWPDALREDMEGVVMQVAIAAEDAYKGGEFTYDTEKETLYDAYLRIHPEAETPLRNAEAAVAQMESEAREREKLAAEEAEKDEQELLRQHREQVATGSYTQEAYDHVLAQAPAVTATSAQSDETYRNMLSEIRTDRTLADGMEDSWHNRMAVNYLRSSGLPTDLESSAAMQYKDMLSAFEEDVLLSDMRIAAALGYESLGQMYAKWGGMDAEKMHGRAETAMRQLESDVTNEAAAAIERAASAYTGTGEDIGYGEVILEGGKYGVYSTAADLLEAVWAFDTISKEDRPSAVAHVRDAYMQKYDFAIAAAMYEQDMRLYAQNAPSKEQGDAIIQYLDGGYDPFRLGIDPTESSIVMDAANAMDAKADALASWAQKNLNQKKGRVFEMSGATIGTMTMQAVATIGSYATGSPLFGSMLGYGLVSSAQEMREQIESGATRKGAAVMGIAHGVSDTLANMSSSEKFSEKIKGFVGLGTLTDLGRKNVGDIAATRTAMGMAKAYGWAFAKSAAEQAAEEVVKDPMLEALAWQTISAGAKTYIDGGSFVQSVANALTNIDVVEAVDNTLKDAGENFIYTLPLAILGGLGDGFRESRRYATELAATGTAEAAKKTVEAIASDLEAPENRDALNKAMHDAQVGKEAVVIAMTDEGIAPIIENAARAQEQADAHATSEKNSIAAAEAGKASAIAAHERMNAGEINPELVTQIANGVEAHSKNSQSALEHGREKQQKQAEADKGFAKSMQEAVSKAEAVVSEREEQAQQNIDVQGRLLKNQQRIEEIIARFNAMLEENPDAQIPPDIEEELEALNREQIQLEESLAPKVDENAVAAQRGEAERRIARREAEQAAQEEAYQQKVMAQQEADEMKPVYQSLSRTQLYVDETQKANILFRTGLKNLGQVNRKFGLKLTSDKSKGATSLDGSFFAELGNLAPGRISQDVTVTEDALMDIVERKKQLKGMQASVGETVYEQYLPDGTFYNIQDPVMQQLTSDVSKATGVEIVIAPLAGNIRAIYDRAEKRIIISNRIGTGEISRRVVMHELTHYLEGSKGYEEYKEAVLKAAYLHDDADGTQRTADEDRIRRTYAESGVMLDEAGVESELAAEATEKIINDRDGRLTRQLLDQRQRGLLFTLKNKIGQFLARKKAKKEGRLDEYEAIQTAYNRLKNALKQGGGDMQGKDPTADLDAAKRRQGDIATMGADGQMQFSLVDVGEMGKGVYESNFDSGTPKDIKRQRTIELWKNVWSQQPIDLTIVEDGQPRQITANFDPDYDPQNIRKTDLGKMMHSKNGSGGDRNVTLNLADDLYDIARTSDYHSSEAEQGKTGATHDGVKVWHYFFKDIIYRDGEKETPYTVWMDVKEKEDGGYVYQLYARKTKEKTTQYQSGEIGPGDLSASSSSDTSVTENTPAVNPYSTQSGMQYSLAPNQFGNKTAQELETVDLAVKEILAGSSHEVIGEQTRLDTAWQAVNERGVERVVDELLSRPMDSWGAQENVSAALCAVLANREGNITTAAAILTRYDMEGSKQGQTLQSRQLIGKLTPEGAIMEMVRKADRSNAKKGIPPGSFPTGEGASKNATGTGAKLDGKNDPSTGWTGKERGGEGDALQQTFIDGTPMPEEFFDGQVLPKDAKGKQQSFIEKTPAAVQEVYHAADELKAMLDTLPGNVSANNPWSLPLSDKQMRLIDQYKLRREKLPGIHYNVATKKQRMLAAIIASDPAMQGDGMTALCQQLEAIDKGYAVVTVADLNYTASQMAQFRAKEGPDALVPKTQEGREALGRAFQAQDNVTQASLMKKWTAGRYANMLSTTATAVRNIAGNVIVGGMEGAATRLAEGIDKRVSKKTGTRTTATATRTERKAANAAFAAEIGRTVSDYFIDKVDTGHGRKYDVGGTGRVFQNEFLETYRNMVDFAMQIGDRPFYEQKYAEELAIIQRLGMKKNEMKDGKMITRDMTQEEMHEEATMRALHRVFQEDEAITGAINSIRGKNPLADLAVTVLIPFTKTPMNVAMRAVEYSPVGLIATAARRAAFGLDSGKAFSISQRDYVMGLGRGLTGTGLCVMGYMLAAAGIIQPGREEEDNANVREVKKALGEPYGMYMKIGEQMREIDWAMPIASALAVGAEFYNALEDGEGFGDAALSAITASVGGQIMDTPMLSAMNDIFRGYDETEDVISRVLKTAGTSLINQTFSPGIIRAIAKATDPYVRDTGADNGIMATLNSSVIQYWPGLRQMLPRATDMTGDYILQSGYYNWGRENQSAALHFLDSFFTPTATIGLKNDDALFDLLDLSYRTGETGFLPKNMVGDNGNVTVLKSLATATKTAESSYTLTLTNEERIEFNRLYGDILFNGLRGASYEKPKGFDDRHESDFVSGIRKMMQSRQWERLSDEEKVKKIAGVKAAVRELVTYQAINGNL